MDASEARALLGEEIGRLRTLPYAELRSRIPERRRWVSFLERVGPPQVTTGEVAGASGVVYQLETQVFWDGAPGGDVRVMVAIDDGGHSAFRPMTGSFILGADGRFVGE